MTYTVLIREPGRGTDELTAGFTSLDGATEQWIGRSVVVDLSDENGNRIRRRGTLVEVLEEAGR